VSNVAGDVEQRIQSLGEAFWSWRVVQEPRSRDEIPPIERPADWIPDWSAAALTRYRKQRVEFELAHRSIDVAGAPAALVVDRALLGSDIARVGFELDVLEPWRRQRASMRTRRLVWSSTCRSSNDRLTPSGRFRCSTRSRRSSQGSRSPERTSRLRP